MATLSWADPSFLYAAHARTASLDLFRGMQFGAIPLEPAMALLGVEVESVMPGDVTLAFSPGEQHQGATGRVASGILAALADTAAGYAVHAGGPAGRRYASVEFHVDNVQAVTSGSGRLLVAGRTIRIGERTANCAARITGVDGTLHAEMGMTMIQLPPAANPEGPSMPDTAPSTRQMTINWHDPALLRGIEKRLPWIDILRGMVSGELPMPPSFDLMGFKPVSVVPGEMVFALDPAEQHYNLISCVHGGILSALCDTAAGLAVHSRLPFGKTCTTLELHINFIRAVSFASGRATCVGKVIHLGGRTATAEARITDSQGRLCAHMGTTLMVLDIPQEPPPAQPA